MQEILTAILLDQDSPLLRGMTKYKDGKLLYDSSGEIDEYIFECGKALASITASFDKAKQALSTLDYEHIKAKSCEEYNLAEYIEFHIENYIIRAHSIYDRTLIFVNKLLLLGIDNSQISHELIVSNQNVKKLGLNDKLKSLKKTFKEYHNIRNSIIHHDRYKDEEFDLISLMHKTESLLKSVNRVPLTDAESLDTVTEAFVVSKRDELSANLHKIEDKFNDFAELALQAYKHKKAQLKT